MQNNKEKKNVFEIENLSFAYDKHLSLIHI